MSKHSGNTRTKKAARKARAIARQAEFDKLSDQEKEALKVSNKALYDASRVYPPEFCR